MPADFDRPTYYPEELSLVEDIVKWAQDCPPFEDITKYIGSLPDDLQEPISFQAATRILEKLFDDKQGYFTKNQKEQFVQNLTEDDQLYFISAFTKYATSSVEKNLIKKFPTLGDARAPSDIYSWSKKFMARLFTAIYIAITPEYFLLRLYGNSVIRYAPDQSKLIILLGLLDQMLADIQRRYQQSAEPSQAEKDAERKLLKDLGFLPTAILDSLVNAGDVQDKVNIFQAVHKITALLIEMFKSGMNLKQINEYFEKAIVSQLVEESEAGVLAKLTSLHDQTYGGDKEIDAFAAFLADTITLENINKRDIANQILTKYHALSEEDKPKFSITLYTYLRSDLLLETLAEPYTQDQVVAALQQIDNLADLDTYLQSIQGYMAHPEYLEKLKMLLAELYQVVRGIFEIRAENMITEPNPNKSLKKTPIVPGMILPETSLQPSQPEITTPNV